MCTRAKNGRDVPVRLAEHVELRQERLMLEKGFGGVAARAEATGDRPACDPSAVEPPVGEERVP